MTQPQPRGAEERLERVEAMLAELLRRFTPREAVPAMHARLRNYSAASGDDARTEEWFARDGAAEPHANGNEERI
jgi:hypothetical protein